MSPTQTHIVFPAVAGEEPVSPAEKYLTQEALELRDEERRIYTGERIAYDASQERKQQLREELVTAKQFQRDVERSEKPTDAHRKRAAANVERAERRLAEEDERRKGHSFSSINTLEEWFKTGLNHKMKNVGTFYELPTGSTPKEQFEISKNKTAIARVDLAILERRSTTMEASEAQIVADYNKVAASGKINVEPTKGVRRVGKRFLQGHSVFPTKRVYEGGGIFADQIDAVGILFHYFGDQLKAKLIAQARENFDPKQALTTHERTIAIAEAEAAILLCEYRAEFWYRVCRKAGFDVGPRVTANPLAILDITPDV